jgi:hypothetical protein
MARNPEFKKVKRKPIAAVRKNAEDPDIIRNYFDRYSRVMQEHEISDEDKWNFDETGFRLGIARSDWVITLADDDRKVQSKDPNNRESLTAIECINGVGDSIPSFLILSGVMIQSTWAENDLNREVVLSTADTDYSND